MQKFAWLCEVRGLIYAEREGAATYAGGYKSIYFRDFKTLAYRHNGQWKLANKAFPLNFTGGAYCMAKELGL